MPVKTFRPLTPSTRYITIASFDEITKSKPEKNLVQIRKSHSSLTHGSFTWLTNNPSYLSFGRVQGSDKIITALNISSIANRQQTLPIGAHGINCSLVTNLFDSSDRRNKLSGSGANQTLTVTHDPWEAKILLCQ